MENEYVYKIYTLNDDADKEVIGYFTSLEDCIEIVENNYGDIQDHAYKYADIVELPIGIYRYMGECKHYYYKWKNGRWNKLEKAPKFKQPDIQNIINKISSYGYEPWIDYGEIPIKQLEKNIKGE